MKFDFLELFNALGAAQRARLNDYRPATSLSTPITEDALSLDSLDVTMVFFILSEVYGIPDDSLKGLWPISSIEALQAFVNEHKTKDPEDEYNSVKDLVEDTA